MPMTCRPEGVRLARKLVLVVTGMCVGIAASAGSAYAAAPNSYGNYASGGRAHYAPVTPAYDRPDSDHGTGRKV